MKKLILLLFVLSSNCIFAQKNDTLKKNINLKEVTVTEKRYQEEIKTGAYNQPEWTTERRFPTTRVYLQYAPWTGGFEQWVKAQFNKNEAPNYLFQEEFGFGLPGRFQLDIYENWIQTAEGKYLHDNISTELRWAFADWEKIPLNPTIYLEWKFSNPDLAANCYEIKMLLGEELAKRWHWGLNLYYEREVAGMLTTELGLSQGISYTAKDKVLNIGAEMKVESETVKDKRNPTPIEVDLGPSIQWRPSHNTHLDFVPLIGLTKDSPAIEAWFVFGVEFGEGKESGTVKPVSTQSH